MIITNIHNLPEPVYQKVVETNQPPKPRQIRVTTLIDAPYKRRWRDRNEATLTVDCSEFFFAFFGQVVHYALSEVDPEDTLSEERLYGECFGVTITGQSDLYHNKTIIDYKTTSYRYAKEPRDSWIDQLNVYAWLWRKAGFEVEKLQICVIMRDWMVRMKYDESLPHVPITYLNIPLWSFDKQQAFIEDRVAKHLQEPPPPCTVSEMWENPTKYAIMQKGKKKAIKASYKDEGGVKQDILTPDLADALMAQIDKPNLYIEERPGQRTCCKDYCLVRSVCPNNIYRSEK